MGYYLPGYGNVTPETSWSEPTKLQAPTGNRDYADRTPTTDYSERLDPTPGFGQAGAPQPFSQPTGPGGSTRSGGWGGGGGGGGAASFAGMDQSTADMIAKMIAGSRPQFNNKGVKLKRGKGPKLPKFYDWDPSRFIELGKKGRGRIKEAKQAAGTEYAEGIEELQGMPNAFDDQNAQITRSPETNARIQAMMRARAGQGGEGVRESAGEAQSADDAFANFTALMAAAEQQQQAGNVRAMQGDERRMMEGLDREGRDLMTQLQFARQSAKDQYRKDRWAYGVERANAMYQHRMQNLETANQQKMLNWQNRNSRDQARNQWSQGIISPIMQIAQAGMNQGEQTLDFETLLKLLGGGQ